MQRTWTEDAVGRDRRLSTDPPPCCPDPLNTCYIQQILNVLRRYMAVHALPRKIRASPTQIRVHRRADARPRAALKELDTHEP